MEKKFFKGVDNWVVLVVVVVIILLASLFMIRFTGRIIYGEPLGAQAPPTGTVNHSPTSPTPSNDVIITADVLSGETTIDVEIRVDSVVVATCLNLLPGDSCVYNAGTFSDGTSKSYDAVFIDELLATFTTPLGTFSVAAVCGDGSCDLPENDTSCYSDCGSCGDGICQSGDEDDVSCYSDCGSCGDGSIAGGEGCDDSNLVAGDGCSATCTIESGYGCVGDPSVCTLIPVNEGSSSGGGGNVAPKILSVSPVDGSYNVAIGNLPLIINFNERMLDSTINSETITLTGPQGKVPLVVSYDSATYTATAYPSLALEYNSLYVVEVSEWVKDSLGKSMGEPYSWQFFTEAEPKKDTTNKVGSLEIVTEAPAPAPTTGKLEVERPMGKLIMVPMVNLFNALCSSNININSVFWIVLCGAANIDSGSAEKTPGEPVASEDEFGYEGGRASGSGLSPSAGEGTR